MGNRAKRKTIAKLLKQAGSPTRLYRGNKFAAFRSFSRFLLRDLEYKLQFKKGQVVFDCDGVNHRILRPLFYRWRIKGGFVTALDQFEFEGNRYSCGCNTSPEKAKGPLEIEYGLLDYYKEQEKEPDKWPLSKRSQKMKEALRAVCHVVDNAGLLYPQFAEIED